MSQYVYILYSSSKDSFYKGQCSNIRERLDRHNSGYELYTKSGVPWKLLWFTEKKLKSEAIKLEKKLKNLTRIRTIELMQKYQEDIVGPDELILINQLSGC